MLIKALCDYYDILAVKGSVLPAGYSKVNIHYKISLTEDGKIDEIINCQKQESDKSGKKIKENPIEMVMPQRTEKPGIDANIVEHRPLYIFGLNLDKEPQEHLTPDDRTDKAKKSHRAFVEANLDFIDKLQSPVISAFRNFLLSWKPEEQTENKWLLGLGKNYQKAGFAFCLSGNPDCLLHEDSQLKQKWEEVYVRKRAVADNQKTAQCAVTGTNEPIARIHSKIKGVYGGLSTGSVLIGFNNDSENSYGNEQSYNSNISEEAMKKYTETLNFLLSSNKHKAILDEMTIVFWAMSSEDAYGNLFMKLFLGQQEQMGAEKTDDMLKELLQDARDAKVAREKLRTLDMIDPNVEFYMLGLKPNSSRLSVKFLVRRKYADILWNIAKFQSNLQVTEDFHSVAFWQIKRELISPKSTNDKVNPELMSRLLETILNGGRYPAALLEIIVRRVRVDEGSGKISAVRAGIIKACINNKEAKEELKVSLDRTNQTPAYLCGRLFAVLEKLQQEASDYSLNRTIKDAYFASASAKPALVFPTLIRLAQNHLSKVRKRHPVYIFYNNLIGEIMEGLKGEFPETFRLMDQGRFDVGYYQQNRELWKKSIKSEETEEK